MTVGIFHHSVLRKSRRQWVFGTLNVASQRLELFGSEYQKRKQQWAEANEFRRLKFRESHCVSGASGLGARSTASEFSILTNIS